MVAKKILPSALVGVFVIISFGGTSAIAIHDVSVRAGDSEGWVDEGWIVGHLASVTSNHIQTAPSTSSVDIIAYGKYKWDVRPFQDICPGDNDPDEYECWASVAGWLGMYDQDNWNNENDICPSSSDICVSWPRPSPYHNQGGDGGTKYEEQWDDIAGHDREMAAQGVVEIPVGEIVTVDYEIQALASSELDGVAHPNNGFTIIEGSFTVGYDSSLPIPPDGPEVHAK